MDAGDIFNPGDSIPRLVMLQYEDTELPIDLDDLDEIVFTVVHVTTGRTLATYALSAGTVVKEDASNGIAWFTVGQTASSSAKLGNYILRSVSHETDSDYENNTHIRTGQAFCFKLIK